jgi:hypothetical protein
MRAQIAQLAALVMHGNARYDYGHDPAGFVGHSTTDMCASVTFCDATDRGMPILAESVGDWFDYLDAAGTLHLQLHYHPASKLTTGDRMLAGFINAGGRWLVEQCVGFKSDLWESNWEPFAHKWNAEYGRIQSSAPASSQLNTEPLEPIVEELLDVTTRLAEVADANEQPEFAGRFERAAELLDSPDPPEPETYPDLAPTGLLPLEARQILSAIDEAWVFTAEGSWNDVLITRKLPDYQNLSDELYRLLTRGLVAVTNSTAIPLARGRR